MAAKGSTCRHGVRPASTGGVVLRRGSARLRRIERHERKPGHGPMVGHGAIFSTVCCVGCWRTF